MRLQWLALEQLKRAWDCYTTTSLQGTLTWTHVRHPPCNVLPPGTLFPGRRFGRVQGGLTYPSPASRLQCTRKPQYDLRAAQLPGDTPEAPATMSNHYPHTSGPMRETAHGARTMSAADLPHHTAFPPCPLQSVARGHVSPPWLQRVTTPHHPQVTARTPRVPVSYHLQHSAPRFLPNTHTPPSCP